MLEQVQDYFQIDNADAGLLQTAFICSYMVLAPVFGYMGDRYSRKWIILFGVSFWCLMTFSGSFVPRNVKTKLKSTWTLYNKNKPILFIKLTLCRFSSNFGYSQSFAR